MAEQWLMSETANDLRNNTFPSLVHKVRNLDYILEQIRGRLQIPLNTFLLPLRVFR